MQGLVFLQTLQVGVEIAVQRLGLHAQHGLHLLPCLTLSAVGGHGQGTEHGQRRDQGVLPLLLLRLEQPQGKVGGHGVGHSGIIGDHRRMGGDTLHHIGCFLGARAAAGQSQRHG